MFRFIRSLRATFLALGAVLAVGPVCLADDAKPTSPNSRPDERMYGRPGNDNDFPGFEAHDFVNAATLAARTRTMYRQAQSALDLGIHRIQTRFERSHDFQFALADEQQAYAEYMAARDKITASLSENSRYRQIMSLRDDVGVKLETRRSDRDTTREELLAMAVLKMQYASDARTIEVLATESSPELKAARAKMVAAARKVVDMRQAFDDSVHDNAEVAQLRKNLEDTRLAMITADTYSWASALAADAALYYSQYLHRNDQGYYAPYGPAAVSSGGYYSPYWGR